MNDTDAVGQEPTMSASAAFSETGIASAATPQPAAWSDISQADYVEPHFEIEPAWKNWFIVGTILTVSATVAAAAAVGVYLHLKPSQTPAQNPTLATPSTRTTTVTAPAVAAPPAPTETKTPPPIAAAPPGRTLAAEPAPGRACDPNGPLFAISESDGTLACAYAGSKSAHWVLSMPLVGIREPGTQCNATGVALAPDRRTTLVCLGDPQSGSYWAPGP